MKFSGSVDNETDDFDGSDIGSAKDPSQGALYYHCLYTVCNIYIYINIYHSLVEVCAVLVLF